MIILLRKKSRMTEICHPGDDLKTQVSLGWFVSIIPSSRLLFPWHYGFSRLFCLVLHRPGRPRMPATWNYVNLQKEPQDNSRMNTWNLFSLRIAAIPISSPIMLPIVTLIARTNTYSPDWLQDETKLQQIDTGPTQTRTTNRMTENVRKNNKLTNVAFSQSSWRTGNRRMIGPIFRMISLVIPGPFRILPVFYM